MNNQTGPTSSKRHLVRSALQGLVYLVDDDSNLRRAVNMMTRSQNIKTRSFKNARQFLAELPVLEPSPVLLHIALAPMEGMRLLRELARIDTRWPVIVMAGAGEAAILNRAMNVGPVIVLRTPYSADDLRLATERAFAAMSESAPDSDLPNAIAGEAKSVTEQKLAEHEVDKFRRALGPFVVAAEATRMPMAFTNATAPGNPLIFANDSFLALTGYTCAEVVGQSFDFLMSGMAAPDAIDRLAAQFDQEKTETIEVECRGRDGQPFLVAIRINPVHDKGGMIVQHCISFASLAEHVEREREAREALHALYQHTPDFIVTMEGPEHRFTFANDAYQRLARNRALIGKTVADALPEIVDQGFIALLDRVFLTGEPFIAKAMPITLDGENGPEPRFVDFIYQAVRGSGGEIVGVFCEGHDATEQKLASDKVQMLQAELMQVTRASAMGTMADTLAHELNQPLAAITNYAGACSRLIDPEGPSTTKLASALAGIAAGARRAGDIIRRMRDASQQRAAHREVFDLRAAVRESIELVQAGAWVKTSIDYSGCHSVEIEADRVQIEQVIMNLVRNASEAVVGMENGKIAVSISVKGSNAIVSVQDNGPGVSPKASARLFAQSPSTKAQGMGIGLSICRNIVEAHGGVIWLESGSGGANLCFSIPINR